MLLVASATVQLWVASGNVYPRELPLSFSALITFKQYVGGSTQVIFAFYSLPLGLCICVWECFKCEWSMFVHVVLPTHKS